MSTDFYGYGVDFVVEKSVSLVFALFGGKRIEHSREYLL